MVWGYEVYNKEILASHKHVVGTVSICIAFSVIVHILLWYYTKSRQVVGSFLKVGCHVESETMSAIFSYYVTWKSIDLCIHCNLNGSFYSTWLCAIMHWLLGKYWFTEICTRERMRVKRQVWCYYENSFDKTDPLKGLGNPKRSQDYSWRTTGLDQSQRSSHPLNISIHSFIRSTNMSWPPLRASNCSRHWEFLSEQNKALPSCSSHSHGEGGPYTNTLMSGSAKC